MHVSKALLMMLIGCTSMSQSEKPSDSTDMTNADVFMDKENIIFVNYDADPQTTISSTPGSHSYSKYIQLTDNLQPGEHRRLHIAVSTFRIENDGIRVFDYLEAPSGFVEAGTLTISKGSKEYSCYLDVVENVARDQLIYLRKADKIKIDRCVNASE
jgi:hypothetical protein